MHRTARFILSGVMVLSLGLLIAPQPASGIPAFARKYGLRCTACHEAWPALNDFGRAFRDNGYQLMLGKDDPTTTPPGYWPVAIRITPHYEYDETTNQPTDQGNKNLHSGSIADIGIDLLTAGTLADNVSFLVVPTGFTSGDGVTLESAWVRFDNLLGSSWLNLKLGKHEVDLPRSAHRPWNLSSTGYLIYGYHSPGAASLYDLGENQRGIEWVGHDRGSLNRIAISFFNVNDSPGSRNAWDTPGIYAHATHEWLFDSYVLSEAKIGVFGAYTTWPTTSFTGAAPAGIRAQRAVRFPLQASGEPIAGTGGNLKNSTKYGFEGHLWFGSNVTPLHVLLVYAHGEDDKEIIEGATRNGTFNGGFLELGYTPTIKLTFFGRYDLIRNQTQAIPDTPKNFNDEDAVTAGIRYTLNFNNRAEYALHAEYSTMRTKGAAENGSDVRANTLFLGVDFAY
jgi:hypothetical protein